MGPFRLRFVIGKLSDEEFKALEDGLPIITKMLLSLEDFAVFHYREGDEIEAESQQGNRVWTTITNMEIIKDETQVIIIFTLSHGKANIKAID
jgi:hypothetical protein